MFSTPWGTADEKTELAPHVYRVSTPSHGGIMVAKATARKILSQRALNIAFTYGGYYAFEEDCDASAYIYEHPEHWRRYLELFMEGDIPSIEQIRDDAKRSLERWSRPYFTP